AVAFSPDGRTVLTGGFTVLTGRAVPIAQVVAAQGLALPSAGAPGFPQVVVASGVTSPHASLLGGRMGVARLWDAASRKVIATLHHDDPVNAAAYSPDGHTVLTGSGDEVSRKGGAGLWDAASGKVIATLPHGGPVRVVAFSPDGRTILTGSDEGRSGK